MLLLHYYNTIIGGTILSTSVAVYDNWKYSMSALTYDKIRDDCLSTCGGYELD